MNHVRAMHPVPVNRVHAMDLQRDLQAEYSKAEWRSAYRSALDRWQADGGQIQRVRAAISRRQTWSYTE